MTPAGLVAGVPLVVWLLVDAVAVYRLTRLITRDSFPPARAVRDLVVRRWGDRALGELVVCPWCVSVWIAGAVVTARLAAPAWWTPVALALAYSAVAGWISERD